MLAVLVALSFRLAPNPPSLDLLGPGPFINFSSGEQAQTNGIAHVWFGLACPFVGNYLGGRKGMWVAMASCAGLVVVRETFFHGQTPGPEVRADLLTGLTPLFVVAVTDLAMH